jgi:hypothetical protein
MPPFYQACIASQLSASQWVMLQMLVIVIQKERRICLERLAALFAQPITFESRRRSIQRFLLHPKLNVKSIWFPILKHWLKRHVKGRKRLYVAIDRTQWRDRNLFVASVIWDKRAIPIYWELLDKQGSSNLREQKALLRPVFAVLKSYRIVVLADREFHSVKLANWLVGQGVEFALRQKAHTYIQTEGQGMQRLESLGLKPGTSVILRGVNVTQQQGFGTFNVVGYWQRHYREQRCDQPWYILTNLGSIAAATSAFKRRAGIEAMFKDCKSGGYHLENCAVSDQRLLSLILLVAIAYTTRIEQGHCIKQKGVESYVCRVQSSGRSQRRHSTFWVGLYGALWVESMLTCQSLASQLMRLKPHKLNDFKRGLRALALIQSTF